MKRIGVVAITVTATIGFVVGFGVDQMLTSLGQPTFTPASTLPVLLVLLAAACLLFAWPVSQQLRGKRPGPVQAIRAFRTATLARSASLVGAATAGFAAGLEVFLLTRPAQPSVGSVVIIGVTIGAAIVLTVCALLAESFCVLPKDTDDTPPADGLQR